MTLLSFAFVLAVLIFVHELGHFIMARRAGVRVLKFSLGFGPRIVGFKRGDTEYVISAIPLGGFVKMAGDGLGSPRSGRDDEFLSKTKWQRFQILIMGPVMNLILAVVVTAGVLMAGTEIRPFQNKVPIVGQVVDRSPAERAGILPGDRILWVAGREINTWKQFFLDVGTRANQDTSLVLLRGAKQVTVNVTPVPVTRLEIGDIGVLPDIHPNVLSILPGSPAEQAGLKPGDVVLQVDGATMTLPSQLVDAISKKANIAIVMTIARNGTPQDVRITPEFAGGRAGVGITIGEDVTKIQLGAIDAISISLQRNYESAGLIFRTIGQLITREASTRQLMGPVAIAQLSGELAHRGWVPLFALMASISLSLGLFNLLPIPVLDGGHIFIIALEGLARRNFSVRLKAMTSLAGFAVLLMLMVTITYNDLTRLQLFERLMPWR